MCRDKLNAPALEEKWNLVKVVCTQPFNKRTQYGIRWDYDITARGTRKYCNMSPHISNILKLIKALGKVSKTRHKLIGIHHAYIANAEANLKKLLLWGSIFELAREAN